MSELITLSSGTSNNLFGTEIYYNLNAIYACRGGGGGYTVNGHSSLSTEYKKYQVNAVKVDLEFFDPTQDGLVVGVAVQSNQNSQALTGNLLDVSDSRQGFVTHSMENTGSQRWKTSFYLPIYKIEGVPKLTFKVNSSQYSALVTANPSVIPYMRLAVGNSRDNTNASVKCMVRIHYYTTLFEKITDTQTAI